MRILRATMIASFGDAATEDLYYNRATARARRFPANMVAPAIRRLAHLAAAGSLEGLAKIPGNRLEKLKGDRADQYSIRVNDQFRIVFRWEDGGAHGVSLVDYH